MNRMSSVFLGILLAAGLLGASGASAHHSFAMFDPTKDVTIEGTVSAFSWQNPHVWIDVTVQVDGKGQNWGLESQSVGILYRQGWKADSLKPGDKIIAMLHPMRDGTPGGQLMSIKLPDGRELVTSMARRPAAQPAPAQ